MGKLELDSNAGDVRKTVDKAFGSLGVGFADLRELYREIDRNISLYIGDRFARGKEHWARLAPATLRARERRWGHYRKTPTDNPGIGVWTGRTKKLGERKGRVGRTKYVRDFGPGMVAHPRLVGLHFGRPRIQPPRPVYLREDIEAIAQERAEINAKELVKKTEMFFGKLGDLGGLL